MMLAPCSQGKISTGLNLLARSKSKLWYPSDQARLAEKGSLQFLLSWQAAAGKILPDFFKPQSSRVAAAVLSSRPRDCGKASHCAGVPSLQLSAVQQGIPRSQQRTSALWQWPVVSGSGQRHAGWCGCTPGRCPACLLAGHRCPPVEHTRRWDAVALETLCSWSCQTSALASQSHRMQWGGQFDVRASLQFVPVCA